MKIDYRVTLFFVVTFGCIATHGCRNPIKATFEFPSGYVGKFVICEGVPTPGSVFHVGTGLKFRFPKSGVLTVSQDDFNKLVAGTIDEFVFSDGTKIDRLYPGEHASPSKVRVERESMESISKGQRLPNGEISLHDGSYYRGWIIDPTQTIRYE